MAESLKGLKKTKSKNETRKKDVVRITKRVLTSCAADVMNTALESIKNKGTGRVYERYNPRRSHQASAPDMPPATDTGFLGQNISMNVKTRSDGAVVAQIVSAAPYSKALEYGTTEIHQRPFMRPALTKNRRNINRKFRNANLIKK